VKIGLIGLPNTGKTTVFNALTRNNVTTGSYASPLGEHHVGQVHVPDRRFDRLVEMYHPRKRTPAVIEFVDVAGITTGEERGSGLSEEMVRFIRDVDALIHVVRGFTGEAAPEQPNPAGDIALVEGEMVIHDLVAVEKRLERLEKDVARLPREKRGPLAAEAELLQRFKVHLETERPLRILPLRPEELKTVRGYAYLSLQPLLVLLNIGEEGIREADRLAAGCSPSPDVPTLALCGKVEAELGQLSAEDAAVFMSDLGIAESGLDRVIRAAYDLLGLQSFFTVGEDEVRAWTIRKGDNAVTAAGKIHSDLARGFIRAEVVAYDDLEAAGTWARAREAGKLRLEGKEYPVRDGDILNIRFNV
jgi:hypothetical protein